MLALTYSRETIFHRLPAALKLAILPGATFVLFAMRDPVTLGAALAGVVALYLGGGAGFASTGLRMLRPLMWFVAIILIWHLWLDEVAAGVTIALRMLVAVALANLVTMTTRLDDMIDVLMALLRPLRRLGVNPGAIGMAVALVIRFTPVLRDKGRELLLAWRARSRRRAGWRIIVPLSLLALDDAEHVAEALRARGGVPRL